MSKIGRRHFLNSAVAAGSTAALSGCGSFGSSQDAAPKSAEITAAPTTLPSYFKKGLNARAYPQEARTLSAEGALSTPPRARVMMIIRGLCAYVLRKDSVDVVLMRHTMSRAGTLIEHHPIISAAVTRIETSGNAHPGNVERDPAPNSEEVKWWDINNMRVTVAAASTVSAPTLVVDESSHSMVNPWNSWHWQLNLKRVYGEGLKVQDLSRPNASVAAILHLTHGSLESALPGRRYGNIGIWRIKGANEVWEQALSDTVIYTLDLPMGANTVTLERAWLDRPQPSDPDAVRAYQRQEAGTAAAVAASALRPIRLKADAEHEVPCGVVNEVNLVQREYEPTLAHNNAFADLFVEPLRKDLAPTLVAQWKDRGMTRNGRSFLWGELKDPSTDETKNLCDPNCNGAYIRVS